MLAGTLVASACQNGESPTEPKPNATIAPPPPPIVKNTFSGQATVVKAKVPLVGINLNLVNAGPLAPTGGAQHDNLLTVGIPNFLSAEVLHAATFGQGNIAYSNAAVAKVALYVGGHSIKVDVLNSFATAVCRNGSPSVFGWADIVSLVIDGKAIIVSGAPNQVIPLLVGKIIINEQSATQNSITVNALHVSIPLIADVVISSAHADIKCGKCGPAFGDYMDGTGAFHRGDSNVEFGFTAGLQDAGGLFGHFEMVDGQANVKVQSTSITGYFLVDPVTRKFTGTALINGQPGTFTVIASDRGNPGANHDTISIQLSTGYSAQGTIYTGNIELVARPPDCK
jgi:hypothetical protein